MYQRDYILRLIEMAAKALAAILGQIKGGDTNLASAELDNLYFDLLKQDAAFLRGIPEEMLTEKLLHDHNFTNGHLEILAELFFAESELCLAKNDKAGILEYSKKSLILFEFIDKHYKTYSQERIDKIKSLKEKIGS
jgi:hypothetical protein